jgi:plastocyanin
MHANRRLMKLGLVAGCLTTVAATIAVAKPPTDLVKGKQAQIVAVDECDPETFNKPEAAGADFCKNVALGAQVTFDKLFTDAMNGTPNPAWDFEPDELTIHKGTTLSVTDQGGEPHTFTEVQQFGGGFIDGLNGGEATAPECQGGFGNLAVARTRILQGSRLDVAGLAKGRHFFQCCIHPWMRVTVDVK